MCRLSDQSRNHSPRCLIKGKTKKITKYINKVFPISEPLEMGCLYNVHINSPRPLFFSHERDFYLNYLV